MGYPTVSRIQHCHCPTVLSQWTSMTRPTQCLPHTAHASTIGSSSWVVILSSFIPCPWLAGHCSCSHSPVVGFHTPQPTLFDASVHILTVACCCLCTLIMLTPFQVSRNKDHYIRSDLNPLLSRIIPRFRLTAAFSSNILVMKVLPGVINCAA